jgi:hypothetical protein
LGSVGKDWLPAIDAWPEGYFTRYSCLTPRAFNPSVQSPQNNNDQSRNLILNKASDGMKYFISGFPIKSFSYE